MNTKKIFTVILFFLFTALLSVGVLKKLNQKENLLIINKGDSYEKLWKRVDSCESKGLTESALKIVEVIYAKSKESNNAPQFVKAVIHKMKFEARKEEFSLEKSIYN